MKRIIFLLLTVSVCAQAAKKPPILSPIPSSVPGITIRNTHVVARGASLILRGMAPLSRKDIRQLTDYGITDVLIFRNDSDGEEEVGVEMGWLKHNRKIARKTPIPFPWKEIKEFKSPCEQLVEALQILKTSLQTPNHNLFFHCTVGEDRTGLLAGLFRIVFEGASVEDAFQNEMCAHGYSRGDPDKPAPIAQIVDENLTPIFLKMVELVSRGLISSDHLDPAVCEADPGLDSEFAAQLPARLESFQCQVLSLSIGK